MLREKMKNAFAEYNDMLSTELARKRGISKDTLTKACQRGDIIRDSRGIYYLPGSAPDDMFVTQLLYKRGIYSHESAVLLWQYGSYSPFKHRLTFPRGYHVESFEERMVQPTFVDKKYYEIGVTEVNSWHGNPLVVYDRERTVLDMLADRNAQAFVVEEMLADYSRDKDKDIASLYQYAEKMNRTPLLEGVGEKLAQ